MHLYRFSFCGVPIEIKTQKSLGFHAPSYERVGQRWKSLTLREAQDHPVQIEVLEEKLPIQWERCRNTKATIVDTKTTWALFRTQSTTWPYLFGFALKSDTGLNIPSVLANKDFSRLKVFFGKAVQEVTQDLLYPLDEVIFRHCLVQRNSMLLHSASTVIQNQGCLFLGDSGAGKSTIAELIETKLGASGLVLTDDRTAVIQKGSGYKIFGTPWHGTLPRFQEGGIPLRNLFFIEQAAEHGMNLLNADDAFERLLKVYLGTWWLAEHRTRQVQSIEALVKNPKVRCYRLGFSKNTSVADFIGQHLGLDVHSKKSRLNEVSG